MGKLSSGLWAHNCRPYKRPSRVKPALILILATALTIYAASVIDKALASTALVAANYNPCFLEGC